jgi:hypothetical protein
MTLLCTPSSLEGFTIFKRGALLVAAVFFSAAGFPALARELPTIEFSVKPRLCVLTDGEEMCYDELVIHWQAKEQMHLCLFRSDFDKPLTCWVDAIEGTHKFALSTAENVTFYLRSPEHAVEVSEAFEVIHDNIQYRRARRNPWSFF